MRRRLDRESAVHYAQMQLHRLGEADAQPNREYGCQRAKGPIVGHVTNISALAVRVSRLQRKQLPVGEKP